MEEGWIDTKGCPCNMQYCTGRSMSQRARILGGGYWIFQCLADVEHLTYDACTIRGQKLWRAVPDQQLCINCRSWKPGRWTEERTIWRSTFAGCSHWRWGHYPLWNGNLAEARKPGSRFGDDLQPSQPRFALGWIPVSKVQPMVLWTKMLAGSWDPMGPPHCNILQPLFNSDPMVLRKNFVLHPGLSGWRMQRHWRKHLHTVQRGKGCPISQCSVQMPLVHVWKIAEPAAFLLIWWRIRLTMFLSFYWAAWMLHTYRKTAHGWFVLPNLELW